MRASEWLHTERGLKQRLKALNLFLNDVYNDQLVIRDGIVPEELVTESPHFIELACGVRPPFILGLMFVDLNVRITRVRCLSLKTTSEYPAESLICLKTGLS